MNTSPLHTRPWSRRLRHALEAPEHWDVLDTPAGPLADAVEALPLGPYRDALHGVWLGHPLHPALVQLPLGCWTSAGLLDFTPGGRRSADALVAAGLLAAGPAALAGWVDWARLDPPRRRTGLVHALSNTAGVLLYAGSLLARCRGRHARGRLLGLAGLTAVSAGAALGGHLAYRLAAGPDRAAAVHRLAPADWVGLGALEDFPPGKPVRRTAGELPVVVVRDGEQCHVLAERCAHLSGPLSEGTVADGCLRCPWHGSEFRLRDGQVVHGPATAPQPVLETRVLSDHLEVRLPGAG
ncbi:nitrite reductase/ring-hydroxylating ferredoxin subunit [Streptomyces sp. 1114.5]|uniref:Rieske 2Fe-2S domain-containing protein n=1 Tax=unclassified Streptomyces TaxID=2593676 RepID=UPI000BD357E1|nr:MULTISPECIES: Rieske (2Fe-2S) protein [unclassified Streptomyces]RKT09471.1 nitrite reductase/ring-hydroxylating ferredoxin subunit [Streptomyces sp. 1114.5]SOB88525.1 Ferredoxin subunit of nitrite reductase or a ring-hydroxylating dioxygenase [Streptomyces sp. 1331.2]